MIPPQRAGDALDALGVCLWAADGTLRDRLDVWREIEHKLVDLAEDDEDRAWRLAFGLVGPRVVDLRLEGCSLPQVLTELGWWFNHNWRSPWVGFLMTAQAIERIDEGINVGQFWALLEAAAPLDQWRDIGGDMHIAEIDGRDWTAWLQIDTVALTIEGLGPMGAQWRIQFTQAELLDWLELRCTLALRFGNARAAALFGLGWGYGKRGDTEAGRAWHNSDAVQKRLAKTKDKTP